MDELSFEEEETYAWQMDLDGFGRTGQLRLKGASVLVSRCGGLGAPAAQQLAAAGVGRLIIAHAGNVKPSDLHRQILQQADRIGRPRLESIIERLRAINPRCEVIGIPEHLSPENADRLVAMADVAIDAAPLFQERLAMNDACVRRNVPMVECAMHGFDLTVTTVVPGRGPCLRCWCPEVPVDWTRRFPVLGGVSATAGAIGATEAIKLLTGIGEPLVGRMLAADLRTMHFRMLNIARDAACPTCSSTFATPDPTTAPTM